MEKAQSANILADPGSNKKRILFVDDEPNILQGLRRMLHSFRQEWDMVFVESGQKALGCLTQSPFDVVVSDMRMPGMDGSQLLTFVKQLYPSMIRVILSGHSDRTMVLRSVGTAHQYLSKPCDAMALQTTLTQACALQGLLGDVTLQELLAGMTTLPSLPTLYFQIIEAMQEPDVSLRKVGEIISGDMGMTAKLLQLVNSAFFGLRRQISTPVEAVSLLGLDNIKALVLSAQIFTYFDATMLQTFALDTQWQHSLTVGACAKGLARKEAVDRTIVDATFTAGLLHDIGKLILASNLPEQYGEIATLMQQQGVTDWQAERLIFGTTHAEVGAYLLGLWGLSEVLVETLAFHHSPTACLARPFAPMTAVHLADMVVYQEASPTRGKLETPAYVTELGCADQLQRWYAQCKTLLQEGKHL